jgi:hypothetical protein
MFYDLERTCYYDGNWKLGLKFGYGKMFYNSGSEYQGEWKNNYRHGKGAMIWENEEFVGEWRNGTQEGYGVYTWKVDQMNNTRCNKFEGQWRNGKRHGLGIYKYSDGSVYEGQFLDNMKHGIGCFISERGGKKIIGHWDNDRLVSENLESLPYDKPYNFVLKDLHDPKVWTLEYSEQENQRLNKIFLRYIGPLRKLYNFYTTTNIELEREIFSKERHGDSWSLSRLQLWTFIKDMKLEKGISLVEMDRFFAKAYKDDVYFSHRYHVRLYFITINFLY